MSLVDEQEYAALVAAKYNEMLLSNFCSVAATTLLFYDYFLTLSREVRCIWSRKFSGATVVFLLNRYLTLLYRVLMLVDMLPWQMFVIALTPSTDLCWGPPYIAAFTSLRTYAIWSKDWKILTIVALLGLIPCGVNMYYYTTVTIVASPPPFVGCGDYVNLSATAGEILFNLIFAIVSDGIVLILTWIKTFEIKRSFAKARGKGTLVNLIQRDGTIYFFSLLVLDVINLVAIKFEILGSVPALTEVVTSILISRFMLNLRGVYLSPSEDGATASTLRMSDMSSVKFASSIAGNLGAPLDELLTDAEERSERVTGNNEEIVYISENPLAIGLSPEEDEEGLVASTLKDLYDSMV